MFDIIIFSQNKEINCQVFRSDHNKLRFESGVIFAVIASCIMHFSNEGSVLQLQRKWFIILWTGRNIIEKVINNVDIQFFRLYIWLEQTFLRIWHLYFYIQISSRKYELDVFFDVINRQRSQLCDVISWFMISWYKFECRCVYHWQGWFEKRNDPYQILNMTKCIS